MIWGQSKGLTQHKRSFNEINMGKVQVWWVGYAKNHKYLNSLLACRLFCVSCLVSSPKTFIYLPAIVLWFTYCPFCCLFPNPKIIQWDEKILCNKHLGLSRNIYSLLSTYNTTIECQYFQPQPYFFWGWNYPDDGSPCQSPDPEQFAPKNWDW